MTFGSKLYYQTYSGSKLFLQQQNNYNSNKKKYERFKIFLQEKKCENFPSRANACSKSIKLTLRQWQWEFFQCLWCWLILMALSLMLILNMYLFTGNHWITALNYSFGWKAWTITTGTSLLQIIFCVRHETLFDKILNRGLSSKIV